VIGTHLADGITRGTYSIGLHIDNAEGKLLTNKDFGLPDQTDSCTPATIDVSGLPNALIRC